MNGKEKSNIRDILFDKNNTSEIVLVNENGQELVFRQVYAAKVEGRMYCILAPFRDNTSQGELVSFLFEVSEEGTLSVVKDHAFSKYLFSEYYKSLKTKEE